MDTHSKIVTLFGGTGFVGSYVVKELADAGYRIRVICRDVVAAAHLKTQGEVGQITCIKGDITAYDRFAEWIDGSYAVINLVGLLFERGSQTFQAIHAQAPEKLAKQAKQSGAAYFVHMSALGVDHASSSKYASTKRLGEKAVKAAFPEATIFRPSVVFGEEDNFFNQFACMSRFSPFLPLIGGGDTKFQPVYVDDVAKVFVKTLEGNQYQGNIYELGGPEVKSFKEILEDIRTMTRRSNVLLPLPFSLTSFGARFAQLLPTPPLTKDQVELLKYDNVVSDDALTFEAFNIQPKFISDIVPHYLERYSKDKPVTHAA